MNSISVMIVDDSETDRYILKRHLKSTKMQVDIMESEDGQIALEMFLNFNQSKKSFGDLFPPKIIFLDINMPILGGFEFLEEFEKLRAADDKFSSCVVMMFSSSDRPDDRKKAFKKEFVKEYIVKGEANPTTLDQCIEKVIADLEPIPKP